MQFTRQNSEGILGGRITVSFRNWKRPHAAVGGVYRLRPAGAVKVTDVRTVRLSEIASLTTYAAPASTPSQRWPSS